MPNQLLQADAKYAQLSSLLDAMSTTRKRILVAAAVLSIGLGAVGGYLYYAYSRVGEQIGKEIAKNLPAPRVVAAIDAEAWKKIQLGMTPEQVVQLLGDPPGKSKREASKGRQYSKEELMRWEYSEYGYVSGLFAPVPHERAYVVYFDRDSKVSYFREPIRDETSQEAEQKK